MGCKHSPDILRGIVSTIRKEMPALSVTELLECPRALWYKKKRSYSSRPSRLYYAFRGTMTHAMIERGQLPGDISEQRFFTKIGGFDISGQPDLIRDRKIYDWKTTKKIPAEPYEHHIAQLSCYRLIAAKQDKPVEIDSGEVVYIDMMNHTMLPAKLWSLKDTEKWMIEKLTAAYEVLSQDEPPKFEAHFNPNDWKCGSSADRSYCDVRKFCTEGQTEPEARARRKVASSKG